MQKKQLRVVVAALAALFVAVPAAMGGATSGAAAGETNVYIVQLAEEPAISY
jgi:hypothetical protein